MLTTAEASSSTDRGSLSGMWTRRIDASNRIVYEVSGDTLMIHSVEDRY